MRRRLAQLVAFMVLPFCVAGVAMASFNARTANTATVTAGTLSLTDDDAGTAAFDLTGLKPTTPAASRCLQVTRGSGTAGTVRLYGAITGALASRLVLKVERGTQASPSSTACNAFTPDPADYVGAGPGTVYSGRMDAYPSSYGAGIVDAPGATESWTAGESHSYRLTVSLADEAAAQGQSATAGFIWEAR